jgi:hypothetical protein
MVIRAGRTAHNTTLLFSRSAARFQGPSSVIGPSTENKPVLKSATIRKNGSVALRRHLVR